jgi:hypothetical protein
LAASRHLDVLYSTVDKLNSKGKEKPFIYIHQAGNIGDKYEYEIYNEDVYKVLIGKTDPISYIDRFHEDIDTFFKKYYKPYMDILDELIKYLVGLGFPKEKMHGRHALAPQIKLSKSIYS